MKKGNITSFRLDPKKPPKSDWRAFDAMNEDERHTHGTFATVEEANAACRALVDKWLALASIAPGLANFTLQAPGLNAVARKLLDIAPKRTIPPVICTSLSVLAALTTPPGTPATLLNVPLYLPT